MILSVLMTASMSTRDNVITKSAKVYELHTFSKSLHYSWEKD